MLLNVIENLSVYIVVQGFIAGHGLSYSTS